ncbi:MAG: hypothetical protein KC964_15600, partial [Candidatus Omnitrophica bacterium]|nr:hypothetical protein [Candidatus Omnitrophota bacterium]
RHPDHDLFSGRSYVIWPQSEVPEWAKSQQILQWGMSVMESIRKDHEIERGFWPSGNHFWVRKRVFNGGRRFHNLWSEAYFTLQLLDEGYRGVYGPEAAAGHRIQPPLLDREVMRKRAILCGKSRANSCLPFPDSFERARFLRDHPIRFRLFTLANGLRWWLMTRIARWRPATDPNFVNELTSRLEMANNLESFRIAGRVRKAWKEKDRDQEK